MTQARNLIFPLVLIMCAPLLPACGETQSETYDSQTDELRSDDARFCDGVDRDRHVFNVTIANNTPLNIVGYLYSKGGVRNKTLLVAVHGATYDHSYWDAPRINGRNYSFACYMARRGYGVLAIDNLGAGESTGEGAVSGDAIHLADEWSAINQLFAKLRSNHSSIGCGFDKAVLVGHSFGSLASIGAQAAGHPADALIVTGWSHLPPPGGPPVDPSIVGQLASVPYVRIDGALRPLMFYGPSADQSMVTYDINNLADQLPRGVFLDGFAASYNPVLTRATEVTGKVLLHLAENDALFGSDGDAERASYPQAQVTAQLLPTVGHSMNLHPENSQGWAMMDDWLRRNHLK